MVTILILLAVGVSIFYAKSSVNSGKRKKEGKDDILDDLP